MQSNIYQESDGIHYYVDLRVILSKTKHVFSSNNLVHEVKDLK